MKFDPERSGRIRGEKAISDATRIRRRIKGEIKSARQNEDSNGTSRVVESMSRVHGRDKGVAEVKSAKMTRRAAGIGAFVGLFAIGSQAAVQITGDEEDTQAPIAREELEEEVAHEREVTGEFMITLEFPDLGEHEDTVSDIYALYLGETDTEQSISVPRHTEINLFEVLENFYDKKDAHIRRSRRYTAEEKRRFLRTAQQAREHARERLRIQSRRPEKFRSIREFMNRLGSLPREMNDSMQWDALGERRDLSAKQLDVLKTVVSKIDIRILLSYALTELFPAQTGFSLKLFEQYLKNGGIHLLELTPAIYDRFWSQGLFQFTSKAHQDLPGDEQGASVINNYVGEQFQIPGSVRDADTYEEQFRSAWLFAVYNLSRLVKKLNTRQLDVLKANTDDREFGVELAQYIASAHHLPNPADTAFKAYINANMSGGHMRHARRGLQPYIVETRDYYVAISNI